MEYYNEEMTDEEIAFLLSIKRKRTIKKFCIITSIFIVQTIFIVFSLVAYFYNPTIGSEEIVIRNEF